jgi:hypothetical protein
MSDILEPYMSNSNPTLEHHGILGMHWGHRKQVFSSGNTRGRKSTSNKSISGNNSYTTGLKKGHAVAKAVLTFAGAGLLSSAVATPMFKSGHNITGIIVAGAGMSAQMNAINTGFREYRKANREALAAK